MAALLIASGLLGWVSSPAEAAVHVEGQVQGGGGRISGSKVSLWAASRYWTRAGNREGLYAPSLGLTASAAVL